MSAPEHVKPGRRAPLPPRWVIRTAWAIHRGIFALTGGRRGLRRSSPDRWGMMRLATIGRRSGEERHAILGYFEDGPNLVTMAMNGWGEPEPAWWLNLQAQPDTTVELPDGRASRSRPRGHRGGAAPPVGSLGRVRRRGGPRELVVPAAARDRRRHPRAAHPDARVSLTSALVAGVSAVRRLAEQRHEARGEDRPEHVDHERGPVVVGHGRVEERVDHQGNLAAPLVGREVRPGGRGDVPQLVVQEPGEVVVDQARPPPPTPGPT